MKMKVLRILPCILSMFLVAQGFAQIPKIGNDTLLDIGTWNIEWFGDTQNGPSNEALQYTNVKDVLTKTDVDVWSLCEVSDPAVFQNLLTDLGKYKASLATYSQTQKTALIWKSDLFNLISTNLVLTESQYDYDFAGRPPLEVMLQRKDSLNPDTIFFYVVHLKAYSDATSYGRRKNAAGYLKTFLDVNRRNNHVIVLGDWNDNILGSTYSGTTISPFLNFVNDSAHYFYASRQLVDQGKKSYDASYGTMIDHMMLSRNLDSFYLKGQARVLDMLPTYISSYVSTTSDHFPVMGYYNFRRYLSKPPVNGLAEQSSLSRVMLYPNPVKDILHMDANGSDGVLKLYDCTGRLMLESTQEKTDVSFLARGIYYVVITNLSGNTRAIKIEKED